MALVDGFGRLHEQPDFKYSRRKWDSHLEDLSKELLSAYPDGERLRAFLDEILTHVNSNSGDGNCWPSILFKRLINSSLTLAEATAKVALLNPESNTVQFAGFALAKLLNEDHKRALITASEFLSTNSRDLHYAIGIGYSGVDLKQTNYGKKDIIILIKILASDDEWVARSAIQAVRVVAKHDQRLAIDLLKCVNIGLTTKVAEDVLIHFQHDEVIPFKILAEDDIDHFLNRLKQLPELNE